MGFGYRLVLIYELKSSPNVVKLALQEESVKQDLSTLLKQWKSDYESKLLGTPSYLVYALDEYVQSALHLGALAPQTRAKVQNIRAVCESEGFCILLADLVKEIVGQCAEPKQFIDYHGINGVWDQSHDDVRDDSEIHEEIYEIESKEYYLRRVCDLDGVESGRKDLHKACIIQRNAFEEEPDLELDFCSEDGKANQIYNRTVCATQPLQS